MLNLTGEEHDATGKSLGKTLTQEDRAGTWVWERGYTVTLDPNGGSGSAKTFTAVLSQDQVFGKDSASVYITDPGYTKSPATFTGLSEQKDGSGTRYQYPFTYKTNNNKILYAQWQEPTYTIKFDANTGSGSMDNETMTRSSSKTLSKNTFTKKTYEFAGWNTKKDGTGKSYTDQQSVLDIAAAGETITLYAQWKKASWYDSGMSKTDASDNNLHDPNSYIVTIPTKISKKGLSVGNINESVTYDVNVTGNIPDGNYVHIATSTSNKLTGKNANLELSVKQGKTVWSEADAYGTVNQDGSISGTTASDTVTISGTAKSVDQYTGLVMYSASLSTSEK